MADFDDNTDCEILETIDTCIESLDCDKPEMFDVFAEEEHSHCDDGDHDDHDDECHCTESCGENGPEDCAGMKVFLEEDGCAHSCLADPEDIEHCLEDFHAQLCTEGETGYFAIDDIEYHDDHDDHDEEDGGDHDGHDHGDEDEFSGSIASSSASVLAFGASFLLGWAQQQ
jgi:hypothetical protein